MDYILERVLSTEDILDEHQNGAGHYLVKDPMLEVYSNRWEMTSRLFKHFSNNQLLQNYKGDKKTQIFYPKLSYYFKNYYINVDMDIQMIPYDFDDYDDGLESSYISGNILWDNPQQMQYVCRKKIYIKERTKKMYLDPCCEDYRIPEIWYFINMYNDFSPVLDYYADLAFPGQDTAKELMLISYETPFATENDILKQKDFNAKIWGQSHADELLGGLHLGESEQEFQVENNITGEWEYISSFENNDHTMWMFGEFASPQHAMFNMWAPKEGFKPTIHGMKANGITKDPARYSIIFNLGVA